MKICIVGAGDVGAYLAEKLAREGYEVIVIDRNPVKLENLSLKYHILTYECDVANMDCFKQFNDLDSYLLLTDEDEVNISAALRLRELYGKEHLIVRLFKPFYTPLCRKLGIPAVNAVESTVKTLDLLLEFPPARAVWEIGNILVLALFIGDKHPLAGKRLKELSPLREKYPFAVVLIWREKGFLIPSGETELKGGDLVYIAVERSVAKELLKVLGWDCSPVRTLFVLGYSRYASYWFEQLNERDIVVKFFHPDKNVCQEVAQKYPNIEVYHSLLTDRETLKAEGIEKADYVWCLGEIDEKNIVVGMFAKELGAKRVGVLLKHPQYEDFVAHSQIDAYILPKKVVASKAYSLLKGSKILEVIELAEGIEIYAIPYDGEEIPIKDLFVENCDFIFALKRNGEYIIPKGDTSVREGDLLMCLKKV